MHTEREDLSDDSGNTTVPGIIKTICAILELPYPAEAIERLEIYYGRHLDFMEMIGKSKELACMEREIWQKIRRDEGFLLEYAREGIDHYLIYLPNSSLNSAAEEATHLINAVQRGPAQRPSAPFDRFYATVITEALGFFGSKLINERRKAPMQSTLRTVIGSFKNTPRPPSRQDRIKLELSHLLLKHRYLDYIRSDVSAYHRTFGQLYGERRGMAIDCATQLGYMLGDRLYYAVKRRNFPLKDILTHFSEDFSGPGRAFNRYLELIAVVTQRRVKP
jgi:hypothetical protein